jgi:5-deoxy-5-amino-3-dehydroquinate synthase
VSRAVQELVVELGPRRYPVLVGPGARHQLAALLPPGARKVAVVTQAGIPVEVDPGVPLVRLEVPDGESAKTLGEVERLCRAFVAAGLSRADAVVAVGGGVVSDLAGFAAACYHRGIPYLTVATTLLAQVDAAIGGKTGVNLPEGKNLVGAFWQPVAVCCDTETLASLSAREWASGRGEMAKYAFLTGPDGRPPGAGAAAALAALPLEEQVARCVAVKAAVVADDEREGGRRMVLNYGHTLAHALEAVGLAGGSLDLRHGEAVAIGLVFAALLARRLGRIDEDRVAEHRAVVEGFGLPSLPPPGLDPEMLLAAMARDKKARGELTFVLDGPRGVEPVPGIPVDVVREVLAEMLGSTPSAPVPSAPRGGRG